jgi:hypothetical protein
MPDAGYYKARTYRLSRVPRPQVEACFAGLFIEVSGYRYQVRKFGLRSRSGRVAGQMSRG